MPTYDYLCGACGHAFEREQRMSEDPIKKCPKCGKAKAQRQITGGNFILKGGGWYADLYHKPPAKKSGASDGDGGGKSESGAKSDPSSKSSSGSSSESSAAASSSSSSSSSSSDSPKSASSPPSAPAKGESKPAKKD